MNIQSILAVTDLSLRGGRALERAALLAARHNAALRLMYAVLDGSAARADALDHIAHLARQLSQRFGIAVNTVAQTQNTVESIAAQAAGADLLVLGHERRRSLAAFWRGHPEMRLMRLCPCPVLVTRLEPRARYGKILVAVNFRPESKRLVHLACLLDSDAEVELFHSVSTAYEEKLRFAEVSAQAVHAYRQEMMQHARGRILPLTDSFDTRRNRVMSTIERGDPARQAVIQQQYAGADLLVIGHRRRSWLMELLAASVAHRVLSRAACDLLLVPNDYPMPARAAPKLRLGAGRATGRAGLLAVERSMP